MTKLEKGKKMIINPKKQTFRENYKLMIGSILPRPIAFISTVSKSGIHNLAAYSFFNGITSNPPSICFAPARKSSDASKKDTLVNIEETGDFVVNVVTENIIQPMNNTAPDFPPEISEFEEVGLTPVESQIVKAPLVKESPINMECKLLQVVQVGPAEPGGGFLVIGEIILFHIQDNLIDNGRIDTGLLNPVGRLAGTEYTTLGKRFSLSR
jgi:flavin reductase (DIM6/NTAB) family NADH-FMN oxidoreductase RutF